MNQPPDRILHVDLQLALHGEDLEGSLAADDRPRREFVGWIGLLAALDELTDPAA